MGDDNNADGLRCLRELVQEATVVFRGTRAATNRKGGENLGPTVYVAVTISGTPLFLAQYSLGVGVRAGDV